MSKRLALPVIALFLLAVVSWVILAGSPTDSSTHPGVVGGSEGARVTAESSPSGEHADDSGGANEVARTDVEIPTVNPNALLQGAALGNIPSFSGRVVDEQGRPIEGVEISAMAMVDWATSWDATRNVLPSDWRSSTNAEGNFLLPEVPRDRLRFLLEFQHPDFATFELFNQPANPGRTRELGELLMDVGFSLSGTVVDPNGNPVSHAEVVPYRDDGQGGFNPRAVNKRPLLAAVFTDDKGEFTFQTLPTQPVRCQARAASFFEAWSHSANGESGEHREGLEIQLLTATTAFGIVMDAAGHPIDGAQIEIRDSRWVEGVTEAPFVTTVESESNGQFQVVLPEGTRRTNLTVGADGFYVEALRLDETAIGAPIEVTLTPIPALTGVVVDEAGAAVAGATVVLLQSRNEMPDPRNTPANASTTSDEAGAFQLVPNLKSAWGGRFNVYAWDEDHALGQSELLRIRESSKANTTALRIVLQRGFSASGRVLQPDGALLPGARVQLRKLRMPRSNRLPNANESQRGGDIVQRTVAAADGTFLFTNLPSGDYRLEAFHAGFSPIDSDEFGLVDVDYAQDLRLVEACGIAGEVIGDIGVFRQLRVSATSPGLDRLEVFVDGNGRFEFLEMMPARWSFTLTDASDLAGNPSFTFGNSEPLARADGIEVTAGVITPLALGLDISGLGRVIGIVRVNGEVQANYAVYVVPQLSVGSDQGGVGRRSIMRQMRSVSTDFQGRFSIAGLQPNTYWILVEQPGGWPDLKFESGNSAPEAMQRGILNVRDARVVEYAFDVFLGGLEVSVANPKGSYATTIRLVPVPLDGRRTRSARLSRQGYTFTGIPVGNYNLMLRNGNEWQTHSVMVPSVSNATISVALPEASGDSSKAPKKK